MSRQPVTAILLGAGRGNRLRPHTDTTPKPLLPVEGRATLDFLLESLSLAGISDVIVVTHHLADQIDDYLAKQTWPLNCRTVRQQELSGTADAVRSALPADNTAPILVSATDYLLAREFYAEFMQFHASHDCGISVSLKLVPEHELSKRSSVRFDPQQNITEIVEKPASGTAPSRYAANLLYILPAGFLPYLEATGKSVRGESELQEAVNRYLQNTGTARGLIQATPSEWTPELA